MTYDQDISDSVSVSEILDIMLTDGTEPSVIIATLEKYSDAELHDIFFNSTCYVRMFNLSFLKKCKYSEAIFLRKQLTNIDEKVASYFVWQIFQSDIYESTKNIFRQYLKSNVYVKQHPYHGFIGRNLKAFDSLFLTGEDVVEIANKLTTTQLSLIANELGTSLFIGRVLQLDFFEALSIAKKYTIIQALKIIIAKNAGFVYPFVKQVITSNEDINIKFAIFNVVLENAFAIGKYVKIHVNREIINVINKANGYEEVMISLQLMGEEITDDMLLYLVLNHKTEMAMGILNDPALGVKDKFPVAEFIYTALKFKTEKEKRLVKQLQKLI